MASGNGGMFGETGASRPIHKGFVQPGHQKDVLRAFRAKSMKARSDQGGDPRFFRALVITRDACLATAD
jgi:hypothetical protein